MGSFREIVTKAVIGKGKKLFSNNYTLIPEENPTTILGCWVINHKFKGQKENDKIRVEGTCDVNIWYSYDNDTKTIVSKQTISYSELLNVKRTKELESNSQEEIIVRSLKQPSCTKVEINGEKIEYSIEKELGIEIVGDTKMRISVDEEEDEWEEISDEEEQEEISKQIENSVEENFINEDK